MDGDDELMKDGALLEEGRLLKEGLKLGFDEEEGRPEREGFNDGDFEGSSLGRTLSVGWYEGV
jgi:hypothetical protein